MTSPWLYGILGGALTIILGELFKAWLKMMAKKRQQAVEDAASVTIAKIKDGESMRDFLARLLEQAQNKIEAVETEFIAVRERLIQQESQLAQREQARAVIQARCESLEKRVTELETETTNCKQNNHLLTVELDRLRLQVGNIPTLQAQESERPI